MARGPNNNDELIGYIGSAIEGLRDQVQEGFTKLGEEISASETRLTTIIKGELEQVHLRLDSIERALATRMGQIEGEVKLPALGGIPSR